MKTELTDNEIRAAIAKACGKCVYLGMLRAGCRCTRCGGFYEDDKHREPDYLTSLDAMAEAEKWLLANRDDKTWLRYVANLQRIAGEMERPPWVKTVGEAFAYAVHAKARQRALAFLATIAP